MGRRRRRPPVVTREIQPDGVPKRGLFTEPVRITHLRSLDVEPLDSESGEPANYLVTFLAEIRDAEDRRCPDFSVDARVSGPERSGEVQGTTDMLGRIRFRMRGPAGSYRIEITDVAAGGMNWDASAGPIVGEVEAGTVSTS